jgi:hypothetical protein
MILHFLLFTIIHKALSIDPEIRKKYVKELIAIEENFERIYSYTNIYEYI